MAPYMMIIVGMVLMWDVTKCVARPADVNTWAEDGDNSIDAEPSGLYGGKASGKADWKKVYRLMEIVRLSKKIEEALKTEAVAVASPESNPEPPAPETPKFRPSPPIYGSERILDQLHDYTGEKQPMHHSALDGWIF